MTTPPAAPTTRFTGADVAIVAGCVALAAWVHHAALGAFFSSPDDLVHLQQGAGLRPVLASPFRILSQVLYFRAMLSLFGPDPAPFHVLTLAVHAANVALLYAVFRALSAARAIAGLACAWFAAFPLFFPLLASAVGMNDEAALLFTLVMLLLVWREGVLPPVLAPLAFVLALLCKESVLAMPLVAWLPWPPTRRRIVRTLPLLAIAAVSAVMLLLAPPQGLNPYAMALGANAFHNLMTYAAWAVNLTRPLPDLVSSFDPGAWRIGVWVYAGLAVAWVALRHERPRIASGLAWWLAGLAPVVPLQFQTFRHYLYPALPGLALAIACVVVAAARALAARAADRETPHAPARITATLVLLCALAYGIQAGRLVAERTRARVPGTPLALDPLLRRQEVARNAIGSLTEALANAGPAGVVILEPEGVGRAFGARSGREYPAAAVRGRGYDLIAESLDRGRAVRLFLPGVDSVAFVSRWTPAHRDFVLFLPYLDGRLFAAGGGPRGHAMALQWMVAQGWLGPALDHAEAALRAWPGDASLQLAHGSILLRSGEQARGLAELRDLVARAPGTPAAGIARMLLARRDSARSSAERRGPRQFRD